MLSWLQTLLSSRTTTANDAFLSLRACVCGIPSPASNPHECRHHHRDTRRMSSMSTTWPQTTCVGWCTLKRILFSYRINECGGHTSQRRGGWGTSTRGAKQATAAAAPMSCTDDSSSARAHSRTPKHTPTSSKTQGRKATRRIGGLQLISSALPPSAATTAAAAAGLALRAEFPVA